MTDHHYTITVTWTGNTGSGTADYLAYNRSFELEAEGKHAIAGSSDPVFRGDPGRWNPEQLLVGSLAACHKLWFLHLAAVSGIVVREYVDHAEGTMRTTPGADTGRFERVTLHPEVLMSPDSDRALAASLHAEAHRRCFIANSVNFPVLCEPVTRLEASPGRSSRPPTTGSAFTGSECSSELRDKMTREAGEGCQTSIGHSVPLLKAFPAR